MLSVIPCLSVVRIRDNLCVCEWSCNRECVIHTEWYESVNVTEMETMSVLNDMIDVRDRLGSCPILNTEDVHFIINDYMYKLITFICFTIFI